MDFAKKQLEKYGWKEGKGLGKNEHGISTPLIPKVKLNKSGIGHDPLQDITTNWWEHLYDKASNNVEVTSKKGKVKMRIKNKDAVKLSKHSNISLYEKNNNSEYGNFIKTSKLTESGIVELESGCRRLSISESETDSKAKILTDDELFAACRGRTVHKGARHGLKLSGKLSRLERQEAFLLKKLKAATITDADNEPNTKVLEKKLKKLDYFKEKEKFCETMETEAPTQNNNNPVPLSPRKSCKKSKKDKRRVSFNETVTEYHSVDTEASTSDNHVAKNEDASLSEPVTTTKQVKLKDKSKNTDKNSNVVQPVLRVPPPTSPDEDEGIDCPDYENIRDEPEPYINIEVNRNRQGILILNKTAHEENPEKGVLVLNKEANVQNAAHCLKCTKRKLKDDSEQSGSSYKKCLYDCIVNEANEKQSSKRFKKSKHKAKVFENRIDLVTDSLHRKCKISDKKAK